MSDSDLFAAVARKTGEDSHEIRRRGFTLTCCHLRGNEYLSLAHAGRGIVEACSSNA